MKEGKERNIMSLLDVLMEPFAYKANVKRFSFLLANTQRDFIRNSMRNLTLNIYLFLQLFIAQRTNTLTNIFLRYWSIPQSIESKPKSNTDFFLFVINFFINSLSASFFFYLMIKWFFLLNKYVNDLWFR